MVEKFSYPVIVLIEVVCNHGLVSCECFLEIREGVARYPECCCFDVVGKFVKSDNEHQDYKFGNTNSLVRVQQNLCELLVP